MELKDERLLEELAEDEMERVGEEASGSVSMGSPSSRSG